MAPSTAHARATTVRACVVLAVVGTVLHGTAHADIDVSVRNNAFDPVIAEVDPGGTVTWRLVSGEHTVTSDVPELFDSGSMSTVGQTFSFTAPPEDGWIFYHCRIHGTPGDGTRRGAGMWGAIEIGEPAPLPRGGETETRAVPSLAWPTLADALTALDDTAPTRIELAPGAYRLEGELTPDTLGIGIPGHPLPKTFELTIRGMGDEPSDVVIDGGVAASLDGLQLENFTITKAPFAGVLFWRGMQRWAVDRVDIPEAGRYGVRVERDARRGRIGHVTVSGAEVAAVSITGCVDCDVLVEDVIGEHGGAGLSALNAGALVVRDSIFRHNAVGISIRSGPPGDAAPSRGAHVFGNTVIDSVTGPRGGPSLSSELDLPVAAGVWLAGSSFATVEANRIAGSSFGVVVTGPAYGNRIVRNVVSDSAESDIAWDGIGANVCFTGNRGPDGTSPTSMPPGAETVYSCDLPATAGIPMPLVPIRLVAWTL